MGLKNARAICPNCGGKIHTQPKGLLGAIAIGATGPLVKTGTTCELCGVKLTGKVTLDNHGVLADPPKPASLAVTPTDPDRPVQNLRAVGREDYLRRRDG